MTGAPLADAAAREEALDPGRSFIVQAPAGSGKTGLLTQRFLVLLARVAHPEEVVAITFTRKAAAEMRLRVLAALRQVGEPAPDPFTRRTRELAGAVLAQDRALGWELEENPNRLRILTIDALCSGLVRQMPVLSGFGSQPGLLENHQGAALYREAARAALAEAIPAWSRWRQPVAVLLDHLDNDRGVVVSLLAEMLARRDQWLRHLVGDVPDRERLEAALAGLVAERLEAVVERLPPGLPQTLAELARFAANILLADGVDSPLTAWAEEGELPPPIPEALPLWQGLAELLLTRSDGAWRKKGGITRKMGFPAPSSTRDKGEKALYSARKEALVAALEQLAGDEALRLALGEVRLLPPGHYEAGQWRVLEALMTLLPMAAAQLQLLFSREARVDFVEVSRQAVLALGDPEAPTDLALRLDYRISHLLVDEFQDTSLNQFQLLERLTAGWSGEDGRTLFLVGDPMQSIYRFREAEVGLFLHARERGINAIRPHFLKLSVNFRSHGGVVAWVNAIFPQVLPPEDDPLRGAVSYEPSVAFHPGAEERAVFWHGVVGRSAALAAERVVELTREALARQPGGRVAILVRARSHLLAVLPALRAAGIEFQAVEIEPLAERQAVLDLLALTRALLHPADRVAWLALLRAPWCGLGLDDLLALTGEGGDNAPLARVLGDPARLAGLSQAGRERVVRLAVVMGRALARRGRLPLRRWVEATWLELGGPATLTPEQMGEAESFLSLLEQRAAEGEPLDGATLAEALEGLYAPADPTADGRVQVMTIHKAKGLEFDTVILPGLGKRPPAPQKRLLLWLERPDRPAEEGLLLAPVKGAGEPSDPIYGQLQRLEAEKGALEAGRLLYVATTRAKGRLHLVGEVATREGKEGELLHTPAPGSFLALLWPQVREAFLATARQAPPAEAETEAGTVRPLWRLPDGWLPPAPPVPFQPPLSAPEAEEERVVFDWAGELLRLVGVVVHRTLKVMAEEGLPRWPESRIWASRPAFSTQLLRLGLPQEELEEALPLVTEALVRTRRDPRGRWILGSHLEARCEWEVTALMEDRPLRVVMDRVLVDEQGVRWIIDYKTSRHKGVDLEGFMDNERERYRGQLERYAAILGRLENRSVRLGLYFPLIQGWREWRPGA